MLVEQFANNAEATLQSAVTSLDTEFFLNQNVTDTAWDDAGFNAFYFMRGTLSHPDIAGTEIVFITSFYTGVSNKIKVVRGGEQTPARAWPAGTKLQSRVTAGMLRNLACYTAFNQDTYGLSINSGDNAKASRPFSGDRVLVSNSWAIGGNPVLVEKGASPYSLMSSAVEGVGASYSVELGVAPDHDSAANYYSGAIVKDPNSPSTLYSMGNEVNLGGPKPALGEAPWSEVTVDPGGGVFRVSLADGWDDPDVRFYPSEIGFICDAHTAATAPTVSVGELDSAGEVVSMDGLASGVALTDVDGAHQRVVLTNSTKKGVRGMIFSVDTAATGGTFKGRFYWKGLFVCSNSAAGWPAAYTKPDGTS